MAFPGDILAKDERLKGEKRIMKKNFLRSIFAGALAAAVLTGCGASGSAESSAAASQAGSAAASSEAASEASSEAASKADTSTAASEASAEAAEIPAPEGDDNKITIGATPVPHAQILDDVVKPALEAKGWDLEVVVFNDYIQPNTAVEDGELDANYFETTRYLEEENKERNLHLVSVAEIHLEPMGLYSKKLKSLDELKDGASIAVPNDGSNESRALRLLADNGLIKVDESKDILTASDVTENPKNFEFVEVEAASLVRTLDDVDAAVINGNYALEAGFSPAKDALVAEKTDTESIKQYFNNLVVKEGNEETVKTKALKAALTSPDVAKYIEENYQGSVIPAFH